MPHSSTHTKSLGATPAARSRKATLSSSSRSEEPRVFFERQAQPLKRSAHGGGGDPDAASFLEKLAMLRQGEIRIESNLGGQPRAGNLSSKAARLHA